MERLVFELLSLLLLFLSTHAFRRWYQRRAERRLLPPGPDGYPLIGNLFDIPTEKGWVTYASMGYKYGTSCALSGAALILTSDDDQAMSYT